jgi:hypothetical protein
MRIRIFAESALAFIAEGERGQGVAGLRSSERIHVHTSAGAIFSALDFSRSEQTIGAHARILRMWRTRILRMRRAHILRMRQVRHIGRACYLSTAKR